MAAPTAPRAEDEYAHAERRTVRISSAPPPRRHRRGPTLEERAAARPDRLALWAVLLGVLLVIVATASAHAAAPRRAEAARHHHRHHHAAFGRYRRAALGARSLHRGSAGSDVRVLQRLLSLPPDGRFGPGTTHAVRLFQRGARLHADGLVGPSTRQALAARRMGVRRASLFGPGLYGRRTACGLTLTPRLHGVAHRTLPCGKRITLEYRGRFSPATVVDRGPYVRGVLLDLTAATARSLGLGGTAPIRARY